MFVNVEQIRDPLEVREPLSPAFLAGVLAESEVGWTPERASELKARLEPVGKGELRLFGQTQLPLVGECHRCLSEVKAEIPVEFTLHLVPHVAPPISGEVLDESEGSETAGSFDLADADDEPFDGKQVDLAPLLREQILLALPMRAVCQEDCRGLCSRCGKNLNEAECGCDRKTLDPRLAPLQNIKV
ncbi:MAG: YceD family protein [Myxococcaceae bacterium]